MTLIADHHALVESIMSDIQDVVRQTDFAREEREWVERLETNRQNLAALLRAVPPFVQQAKAAMQQGIKEALFARAETFDAHHWTVDTLPLLQHGTDTDHNALCTTLIDRAALYCDAFEGTACRLYWMDNGEEYIVPFWALAPSTPRETYVTETWSKPSDRNRFPHHQIGYIRILAALYDRWDAEHSAAYPDHPTATVHVQGKAPYQHPVLPVKAMMLDAVDRLPPVFFAPDKLRGHLNTITQVTLA